MYLKQTIQRLAAAAVLLAASHVSAQFQIPWHTIAGGGAMNTTGGAFTLSGTIGQPDAQVPPVMSGGGFDLTGGFWAIANVCTCPGDLNGDGLRDGRDVQNFAICLSSSPGGCSCADVDGAGGVNLSDVGVFIGDLLAGPACP